MLWHSHMSNSQEVLRNIIRNMYFEITLFKSLPYLPGANALNVDHVLLCHVSWLVHNELFGWSYAWYHAQYLGYSAHKLLSGIILRMGSINERRRYNVTASVIGWAIPRLVLETVFSNDTISPVFCHTRYHVQEIIGHNSFIIKKWLANDGHWPGVVDMLISTIHADAEATWNVVFEGLISIDPKWPGSCITHCCPGSFNQRQYVTS